MTRKLTRRDFIRIAGGGAALFLSSPGSTQADESRIPALRWVVRYDWINVRRDVTPQAVGDGKADDTAALQAGLDALSDQTGGRNTLHLPAGVYRITRTLKLSKRDCIAILGCGRNTRIVWDGPGGTGDDSRMFWCEGSPRSRFVGITWDGNQRANVGFDHDSHSLFETEIDHSDEAFIEFPGSGFRVGHNQTGPGALATAETSITNCLFERCGRGIAILQFNDYDFTVSGCKFKECGTALYGGKGCNFYVRDCRFERSKEVDIVAFAEHGCSVRRCLSIGSRRFLHHDCIAPMTLQNCLVSGWTDPEAAITLNWGPVLVFDCVFADPPNRRAPIRPGSGQRVTIANNSSPGCDALIQPDTGAKISIITAPPSRSSAGVGVHPPGRISTNTASSRARDRFLSDRVETPKAILDVKRRYGAKGDGKADDTQALQAAIDSARRQGGGSMVYLPSGDYVISSTLNLTGGEFRFGGCGTHTRLIWRGAPGGVMVHVHDPHGLVIENLSVGIGGDETNEIDILQTDSGAPSSVRYERVWVYGMYSKQPERKGFHARGLGPKAVVLSNHFTGNLHFTDCARARILFNTSYEGAITIDGRRTGPRDGILGFQTRLGTLNLYGIYVRDSHNLVMSDYYVEQADGLFDLRGKPDDPPGRITIEMPKSHCTVNPVISVDDYHGCLTVGPSMLYPGGIDPARIVQQGGSPFSLVWMACMAYNVAPEFSLAPQARLTLIGNEGKGMGGDQIPAGGMADVTSALDDLRRLGDLDLTLNFSHSTPAHTPTLPGTP